MHCILSDSGEQGFEGLARIYRVLFGSVCQFVVDNVCTFVLQQSG